MSKLRIHRSSWRRGYADGIAAVLLGEGWTKAAIYRAGKKVGIEHGEMRDAVARLMAYSDATVESATESLVVQVESEQHPSGERRVVRNTTPPHAPSVTGGAS